MKLKKAGKDAAPANPTTETTAKGGHSNLIPAIVIAVGMLGGGYFVSTGGGNAAPAAPAAAAAHGEPKVKEEATHGPVQNLEPITLNLADGHFLKVGLALQLAEVEGGHEAAEELPPAKALDIAIALLGEHTIDDLATPKSRELVKKELSKEVAGAYTDPVTHSSLVTKVYFTEFVMQ